MWVKQNVLAIVVIRIGQVYQYLPGQIIFPGRNEYLRRMDTSYAIEHSFSKSCCIGKRAVCGLFSVVLHPFNGLRIIGCARSEHDRITQFNQFVCNCTCYITRS